MRENIQPGACKTNHRRNTMFGGTTYDPAQDGPRLSTQLKRVQAAMLDGEWHTLAELAARCGGSEAAISARIRDFRKPKFGGHTVERQRVCSGLWRYRLVIE